jgi:hypothetical protein
MEFGNNGVNDAELEVSHGRKGRTDYEFSKNRDGPKLSLAPTDTKGTDQTSSILTHFSANYFSANPMSVGTDSAALPSSHSPDTFDSDDLHLRTTPSLLHLLGKHVNGRARDYMSSSTLKSMKQLAAVSFLLARTGEVVACMPKRTNTAMTILLATPESHYSEPT